MAASRAVGKWKHESSGEITFCCNLSVNYVNQPEKRNILKNRIYSFNCSDSWNDLLADLLSETDIHVEKTDTIELSVAKSLAGAELFHPDCDEEISVLHKFDKTLKYVNFCITKEHPPEISPEDPKTSSSTNAFTLMMEVPRKIEKSPKMRAQGPRFTAKDRLYNDLVSEMTVKKAFFPNIMTDQDITKHVMVVVNTLWYVDGSLGKLENRFTGADEDFPKRMLTMYSGYNDWKKHKKKMPQLSALELNSHSTALFGLTTLGFVSSWGEFGKDLQNLVNCLNSYSTFLDDSNKQQKQRQDQDQPPREVYKDSTIRHVSPVDKVENRYAILNESLSKMNFYQPVFFDELIHISSPFRSLFERYDFIQNIALSHPIDILKYSPGGSVGNTVFLWKIPNDRDVQVAMKETMAVVNRLKPQLPEFHTRRMRSEFVKTYGGLHATSVPKYVLRSIYAEMTLDASVSDSNPAVDERLKLAVLTDDPDLVIDLRHDNSGAPGNSFQPFFDALKAKVEDLTAADERRHGIEHMAKYVSVRDLMEDVKRDLPPDAKIPSESTVLFSFAPKNAYINTSRLYKSLVPLKFKVQTRQLRLSHMDEHFCAAQYKYMRLYAIDNRDNVRFLSIDDKSKIDYGEPGQHVASGVRGKKSIVPSSSTLSALDHDVSSKGSLTPSVCLDIDVPEEDGGTFYKGAVTVTYKDSVFQPSSPWRHAAEIHDILQHVSPKPILMIFSDGGPDHRVTYHSVKLSLIVLFKCLDLDMLIAGRTAPGHSWLNPVERIMSTLNIAIQNAALSRTECTSDMEQCLRGTNSMADIRKKSERVQGLKEAWVNSIQPLIEMLRRRTERMSLKGVPFVTHDAAADDVVNNFEARVTREIDESIEAGRYQKKDLAGKSGYQQFLASHCIERQYVFQIRKCGNVDCCRPRRIPVTPWLPDPVLAEDGKHYKPFRLVLGTKTTDDDRPSAKNTTIAAVAEEVQGVKNSALVAQNVRRTIDCSECDKPRCVYSKKSLTLRDSRSLGRLLEKYDYTCGSLITPEGDALHGTVFVRLQLSCASPIEFAYYASSSTTKKDICCHCAADNSERDADLLTKFRVVLPICIACRNYGKEPLKRMPIK